MTPMGFFASFGIPESNVTHGISVSLRISESDVTDGIFVGFGIGSTPNWVYNVESAISRYLRETSTIRKFYHDASPSSGFYLELDLS